MDYLNDISQSADDAISFIEGMRYEEFVMDRKTLNAVVRSLEIMGEASRHVPKRIRDKASDIPWGEMKGLRNRIAHEYFGIDNEIVWHIVSHDLLNLKQQIAELIRLVMHQASSHDDAHKNYN
ncbi:MAG: DUF86 domain-containing protein [Nitrospirae bacterium]|nr:DUF86 domain-containing protein [Nitrospirota bacterium]